VKEFNSAVREATEDAEAPLEFAIDGQVLYAHKPTDGQIAMTMAALGRHTSNQTKIAGIIDFFVEILDEDSHQYIVERLLSRNDPLGLEQVEEILDWLVEEWTGRPTQQPSVSTRSRQSGGQKSKATTRRSTSSTLAPASS
jgi:hypothetical protein